MAQVVDIVEDKGIRTAILNVSFTCHMPDCLEMPYFPEVRGAEHIDGEISDGKEQPLSTGQHLYRLGGNSCLAGDFMGFWQFGHDGITHPSIAMVRSDGELEMLREFGYEDYRNRMD